MRVCVCVCVCVFCSCVFFVGGRGWGGAPVRVPKLLRMFAFRVGPMFLLDSRSPITPKTLKHGFWSLHYPSQRSSTIEILGRLQLHYPEP